MVVEEAADKPPLTRGMMAAYAEQLIHDMFRDESCHLIHTLRADICICGYIEHCEHTFEHIHSSEKNQELSQSSKFLQQTRSL